MNGRLSGRCAIVTGASRGIGEAVAAAFAREGARVVVAARKQEGVDAAAARINEAVGEVHGPVKTQFGFHLLEVTKRD